jgi:exodeoxyribonuclease VII small subunit
MPKKKPDIDFAKAFQELEETATWFERGELDIDEGLKRFKSAMETASILKECLADAENQVKEIREQHVGEVE